MSGYANNDVLVSTQWLADHLQDPELRVVEVDVDTAAYDRGHIPGAAGWNWQTQLQDPVRRDIATREDLQELLRVTGIDRATTVVLYGDNSNWFAAWAYWQLASYGHERIRILDGGRKKWEAEGRAYTTDVPSFPRSTYELGPADKTLRALRDDVFRAIADGSAELVDVRSPQEFTGEVLAPPGLSETAQRGGHIPGASSIPWARAVQEDGTFKSYDELKGLYAEAGIHGTKRVITYCRIGERSSHSWFVLRYLLGFEDVRNYDGSWTEWGNLVGAPIERGAGELAGAAR